MVTTDQRTQLEKLCDPISNIGNDESVQLLIEDLELHQKPWKLSSQMRKLSSFQSISFDELMTDPTYKRPQLLARRKLALILAYSVFQLHESPWLSNQWDKSQIHFLYGRDGKPDIYQPYLTTPFDDYPTTGEIPNINLFHKNAGILKLGVFLVEIHKWKPISAFYDPQIDLSNGQPTVNTDMHVARRILEELDDCFPSYTEAIRSCLNLPWVPAGSRVRLEDEESWNAVYSSVIAPIEEEIAFAEK